MLSRLSLSYRSMVTNADQRKWRQIHISAVSRIEASKRVAHSGLHFPGVAQSRGKRCASLLLHYPAAAVETRRLQKARQCICERGRRIRLDFFGWCNFPDNVLPYVDDMEGFFLFIPMLDQYCTMTTIGPIWTCHELSQYTRVWMLFNPFTPESDQCQISPAASASILHHIVWRT